MVQETDTSPGEAAKHLKRMFDEVDIKRNFIQSIDEFGKRAHDMAVEKGFYDPAPNFPTLIALMHSELSEAMEADRKGNPVSAKIPGYSQVEEELADLMIRLLDASTHLGLNLGGAVVAKMHYNAKRPHKHGKEY